MHAMVAAHVGEDLARRARLRAGELKGERFLELRRELALVLEPDAAPLLARERLRPEVKQVDEEELLEGEPRTSARRLGERRRTMHHPQRVADAGHPCYRE